MVNFIIFRTRFLSTLKLPITKFNPLWTWMLQSDSVNDLKDGGKDNGDHEKWTRQVNLFPLTFFSLFSRRIILSHRFILG